MTHYQFLTAERENEKDQLEKTGTQGKTRDRRGREPSGCVTVGDIGSPYTPTDIRHNYESVDFGDSGEELI